MKNIKYILLISMMLALLMTPAFASEEYPCICGESIEITAEAWEVNTCPACGSEIMVFEDGGWDIYQNDEEERAILAVSYDAEGKVSCEYKIEYIEDEDGNLTGEKIYENGVLLAEMTYGTDFWGLCGLVSEVWYDGENRSVTEYDQYGNSISSIIYDGENNVISNERIEYENDEEGNVLRQRIFQEGRLVMEIDNTSGAEIITEYDEEGTKTVRRYDERGDLRETVYYNAQDQATRTQTMEHAYDQDGFKTSETFYENGILSSKYEYALSADGWAYTCRETWYTEDGSYTVFEYGEKGENIALTDYDAHGTMIYDQHMEFTYDENGKKTLQSIYAGDFLCGEVFYELDEYGWERPAREIVYLEEGGTIVTEYTEGVPVSQKTYDAEGHLLEETDEIAVG